MESFGEGVRAWEFRRELRKGFGAAVGWVWGRPPRTPLAPEFDVSRGSHPPARIPPARARGAVDLRASSGREDEAVNIPHCKILNDSVSSSLS